MADHAGAAAVPALCGGANRSGRLIVRMVRYRAAVSSGPVANAPLRLIGDNLLTVRASTRHRSCEGRRPAGGWTYALVGLGLVDRDRLSRPRGRLRRFLAAGIAGDRRAPTPPPPALPDLGRRLRRRAGRRGFSRRRLSSTSRRTRDRERAFPRTRSSNSLSAALPGMPSLPQVNTRGPSYGGFVGYNWQIDDVVFGAEFNVNRSSLHQNAYNSVTPQLYSDHQRRQHLCARPYVNVTSAATVDMSDYFTVRGRLGWAFGNFLPYLVAGVSFAQIDSDRHVSIDYTGCLRIRSSTPNVTCPSMIGGKYPFDQCQSRQICPRLRRRRRRGLHADHGTCSRAAKSNISSSARPTTSS